MSDRIDAPEAQDALPVEWVIEYDEHPTHPGSHVGPFQTPLAADIWAATFARPGWRASYVVAPLYRPDRPSDLARAKAGAWDEGEKAGAENQSAWDGWRYKRGYPINNPYRADRIDPTEGDALCGDYPAPCNCDDPTVHNGHRSDR